MNAPNQSTTQRTEPHDDHMYNMVGFYADTFRLLRDGVQYILELIEKDVEALESDVLLKSLVPERDRASLPIYDERERAQRAVKWLNEVIAQQGEDSSIYHLGSFSHYVARYLKSAGMIYLQELKQRRNVLASRPKLSRQALQTVDKQISMYETKLQAGILAAATPVPFLADQFMDKSVDDETVPPPSAAIQERDRPRPVVIDTIEILDIQLRARCLDLFDKFSTDGQLERLDTVLMEATRLLEERIRRIASAPPEHVGTQLADFAFGGDAPRLILSQIEAEQKAGHLLFRGVFGFIRNQTHHKLMGALNPHRVLQTLGFIDYLIGLVENAETQKK